MKTSRTAVVYGAAAATWFGVPLVVGAALALTRFPPGHEYGGRVMPLAAAAAVHTVAGAVLMLYGADAARFGVTAPVVALQCVAAGVVATQVPLRAGKIVALPVLAAVAAVVALAVSRPSAPR